MKKIVKITICLLLLLNIKPVLADTAVAKIGTTNYNSITEAINAASENAEIILLQDRLEKIEIPEGKKITINLNNHTLMNSGAVVLSDWYIIYNNGNLTLKGPGVIDCI